ncbi:primosomal replication protein N [Chitinimonas sp. BJB300]|uniref:primosomal replication protein N n=1 Tax=Chitinimonas sp. BJB300 TaxID=1559339 RepID=UPI000C0FA5C7|nr:primosomal replication protein N [Chitinimonas sp. BJB300]PHV11734.1 primosomal replication protein N [Chitinimonas sp. BJB300]TSJ90011.1 primosomal replication protein N [Chitinimonas sp. BJB300]
MNARNQVVVSGRLLVVEPLRYTPAGIPALEFRLVHDSSQQEAGVSRQVQCEITCIYLGERAKTLAVLGTEVEIVVKGFLAARNQRYKHSLVLHINDWKRVQAPST